MSTSLKLQNVLHGRHDNSEHKGHCTADHAQPRSDIDIATVMHIATVIIIKAIRNGVADGEQKQTELKFKENKQ